jgi:Fur family ferric uptake transcriptional regulator
MKDLDNKKLLEKAGLKSTSARLLLLEILRSAKLPKTAAQLLDEVGFDRATLFRNLKALEEAGVLSVSDFGRGASYYRLLTSEKHQHHILCVSCERMEPLDFCVISPMVEKANRQGFRVLSHHLELTGLCPKCA